MFQPQPPAGQRRHRRLPSGTVVSYAEVKSYLSKREIPQLFESLMAGLMYHRPENHIGYLQTCLDEVKTNSETKVHWSTFVNKKRKSKEILPPLTPKKQDSFSSSWSDNSRQSTPLPPISARTRTRTSPEQKDLRNTYILYHNPPPILAKPKVPVISVLGGLGARIDELCEKVVGRLRGVVHISTCSMLKTRMTIEGFYRVTSVPACAVVDSVLQAMSMVQSANALLVAGFPRNRGDIEEYRSRSVRMDGVVLVDFEEEALRRFLNNEVSHGAIRVTDVETELERYKQDIISVAEYYDDKELLTVVMGDQDTEEMIEDMVIAIDKIIETRKDVSEDDSVIDSKDHNCGKESPCKALVSAPHSADRPSTVEIRDATEEDIKSIEAESRNSKRIDDDDGPDEKDALNGTKEEVDQDQAKVSENESKEEDNEKHVSESSRKNSDESDRVSQNGDTNLSFKSEVKSEAEVIAVLETSVHESSKESEHAAKTETNFQQSNEIKPSKIPIVFAFENIKTDYDILKDLIVEEIGMCYINFHELVRSDGEENDRLGVNESINLLQSVLKQDSVSYSNGFFIFDFPFDLLKESKFENILKLGEVSFVCKVKEKSFEAEAEEKKQPEEVLFESLMSERVRIIFVTESNVINELKSTLLEVVGDRESHAENSIEKQSNVENNTKNGEAGQESDLEKANALIDKEEKVETENSGEGDSSKKLEVPLTVDQEANGVHDNTEILQKSESKILENSDIPASNIEMEVVNQEYISEDKTSTADNEDSTCRDVDDLITDDTLNERTKPDESLKTEGSKDVSLKDGVIEDLTSQMNEEGVDTPVEIQKGVLSRQQNLDLETPSVSDNSIQLNKDQNTESENEVKSGGSEVSEVKTPFKRQGTYSSIPERSQYEEEVKTETSDTTQESGEAKNEQATHKEEDSSSKEQAPQNLISVDENKETADTNEENDKAKETKNNEEESSENVEKADKSEQSEVVADEVKINNTAENEKDTNSEAEQDVSKNNDFINENQKEEENHSEEVKSGSGNEINKNSEEEEKKDETDDGDRKETDQSHSEEEEKTDETGNGDEKETDQSHGEEEKKTDGAGNGDEKETNEEDGEEEEKAVQADDEENKTSQADGEDEEKAVQADDEENKTSQADGEDEEKAVQADDEENKTSQADGEDEEKAVQADDEENKTSQADDDKENSTDQADDEANKSRQTDDEEENKTNQADVEKEPESESKENSQDNEENTEVDEKDIKSSDNGADDKPAETKDEDKVDDDAPEKASEVTQEENSIGDAIDSASETKNDENSSDGGTGDKVSGENAADDKDSSEGKNDESIVNSKADGIEVANDKREENSTGNEASTTTEQEIVAGEDGENQEASEKNEESESKQVSENNTTEVEKPEIAEQAKDNGEENNEVNTTKDETENKEENSSAEPSVLDVDDANAETKSNVEDESADKTDNEEPVDTAHQESTENTEDSGTVILKSMDNDSDSNDEKSVTIETQAEVHAPDSLSPLLVQSTDEPKTVKDNADEEENSVKDREKENNDQNSENGSILQNESALENTDESQTTTENELVITQNERFSAKHQERNGSGILGESREEDHPEAEQQERSSSSSRGEL